jgi:hypothetical protein
MDGYELATDVQLENAFEVLDVEDKAHIHWDYVTLQPSDEFGNPRKKTERFRFPKGAYPWLFAREKPTHVVKVNGKLLRAVRTPDGFLLVEVV